MENVLLGSMAELCLQKCWTNKERLQRYRIAHFVYPIPINFIPS